MPRNQRKCELPVDVTDVGQSIVEGADVLVTLVLGGNHFVCKFVQNL